MRSRVLYKKCGLICSEYQILPHAGGPVEAGVERFALEQNVPLRRPALPAERPEPLRRLLADLAQADDNLALQAMKRSEDGTAVIVRLCETDGRRGAVRMSTPVQPVDLLEDVQGGPVTELPYRPFEILSFAVPM